jgi:hypothetical protein
MEMKELFKWCIRTETMVNIFAAAERTYIDLGFGGDISFEEINNFIAVLGIAAKDVNFEANKSNDNSDICIWIENSVIEA